MVTTQTVLSLQAQRTVTEMLTGQRMAAAEPTKADVEIAQRQAAGELTADEAAAEAIAAARAPFRRS